jgi:hypothetical protein
MNPQALGQREIRLLRLYCGCQFGMSPQAFYARWDVTHAQIAQICGISQPSVDRWFSLGKNRRTAEAILYNYELFVALHQIATLSCKRTSNF